MKLTYKIRSKIISSSEITEQVSKWKANGHVIVFTNGCFDILHRGHIELLIKAASFGDKLIIGLNTDNSVKNLKGEQRPFNDQQSRAIVLASLMFIDAVVLFDEETPYNLISSIKPDVLVKGGDYKEEDIAGADVLKLYGGKVKIVDFIEGYSTSLLEKRIRKGNS